MSIYLEQIEQLIALQKVDDEIYGIRKELEKAPKTLDALKTKFKDVEARRERQLDKMSHLHEQEKNLGIEIEDESARLKKSKNKIMQAGNSKEYNAIMREMDNLERMNRDKVDEKSTLIEELLLQRDIQKELDEEYEALKSQVEEMEAGIKESMSVSQKAMDALLEERKTCAKDVPAPVFSRYEFIRERLSHPVIVPVTSGVCSGCNIAIPPQGFIELQKGTQILSCPNCQRLMFWVEHFSPVQEAE